MLSGFIAPSCLRLGEAPTERQRLLLKILLQFISHSLPVGRNPGCIVFPGFKYPPLSLCKSPNEQKPVTDYYTVAAFAVVRLLRSDKRYVEDAVAANRLVLVENT